MNLQLKPRVVRDIMTSAEYNAQSMQEARSTKETKNTYFGPSGCRFYQKMTNKLFAVRYQKSVNACVVPSNCLTQRRKCSIHILARI